MLRARRLRRPWVVGVAIAWTMILAVVPRPTDAAPLPPLWSGAPDDDPEGTRARLEEKIVATRLAALGLSATDTAAIVTRLTREERAELASRADEVGAGGDLVLIAALILIAAVLLYLPLAGKVHGWW